MININKGLLFVIFLFMFTLNISKTQTEEIITETLHVRIKSVIWEYTHPKFPENSSQFDFQFLIEAWNPFNTEKSFQHSHYEPLFWIEGFYNINYSTGGIRTSLPAVKTKIYSPGFENVTSNLQLVIHNYSNHILPDGKYSFNIENFSILSDDVKYYHANLTVLNGSHIILYDTLPENWGFITSNNVKGFDLIVFVTLLLFFIKRRTKKT